MHPKRIDLFRDPFRLSSSVIFLVKLANVDAWCLPVQELNREYKVQRRLESSKSTFCVQPVALEFVHVYLVLLGNLRRFKTDAEPIKCLNEYPRIPD